ncbi:type I restriction-modification system subunit M [Actinomadura montaniterrae]|uniref:type I restriction-modification system subunit M n=1 Tax=Actinomadura montaniterrae TaxID=1803903 RepID=UPI001CEF9495|nr:type I restriction-modification system subunit M [Actinomadura montaniterrae]
MTETGIAELQDVLWKAAAKLRGSMDSSQYRDFVLGLVFLKYASSAFGGVPESARWPAVVSGPGPIGARIDAAMAAVMRAEPSLDGALPLIFGADNVDQRRLADLAAVIGDARFTGRDGHDGHDGRDGQGGEAAARDLLGEVYEYFLETFARAEGRRGGEFYTPKSVVKLLVEVLEPYKGRVYDPCCGSGGMFVQAEKFVLSRRGRSGDIAVHGQEANARTWRLARMNLAIHGIAGDLSARHADTFYEDAHPGLLADHVLANPPFNMSDWYRDPADPRWRFGVPPAGNANFAWMQHIVVKLGPRGGAGVVMANGSMSSRQSAESAIRTALVEADLVSCVVALPPQLFRTTPIPACLWFFAKDKGPDGGREDRRKQVLFVDARSTGTLLDRTERVLTSDDIARIAGTYHSWRGGPSARAPYADEPGFCRSVPLDEIRDNDHVLTPGRYAGAAETAGEAGEPVRDRVERLTKELLARLDESARLDDVVRARLERLDG